MSDGPTVFRDVLLGTPGDDTIDLLAGDDSFDGQGGFDTVAGNTGDDTLLITGAGSGLVDFDGGADSDTIDTSSFNSAVWIDLDYPGAEVYTRDMPDLEAGSWRALAQLSNVENIIGSNFADELIGDDGDNDIAGGDGDDELTGEGGNDELDGGAGNDTAIFNDVAENYTITNVGGNVVISHASEGTDTVLPSVEMIAFADRSFTFAELAVLTPPPVFTPNADVETLPAIGGVFDALAGDDNVSYTGGIVTLDGNAGVDTINFAPFASAVWVDLAYAGRAGWTRDDTNVSTTSNAWRSIVDVSNVENVTGSDFADELSGDAGGNVLSGGGGNDSFETGTVLSGNDTLDGGAGSDTADYRKTAAGVTVDLSLPANQATGTEIHTDQLISIENVGGGSGSDMLTGDGNANTLLGRAGDDTLNGGGGADILDGGSGFDTVNGDGGDDTIRIGSHTIGRDLIDGGTGTDTLDLSQLQTAGWVDLASLSSEVFTRGGPDLSSGTWQRLADTVSVENIRGTDFADDLMGDAADNVIEGGDGDDRLEGRGGNNTLDGGAGDDTAVFAGTAASYVISASGSDIIVSGGVHGGTDTVRANVENFAFADATFTASELASLMAPTFTPGDDDVSLPLNGGTFDALAGNDTLEYTGGVVTLDGGADTDAIDFSSFGSAVWVDLAYPGPEVWTRDGADVLSGTWRFIADLQNVENVVGTDFADDLKGDGGDNVLTGGAGNDLLEGDGGNDTFFFGDGFGSDTIVDFDDNDLEQIDFSGNSNLNDFADVLAALQTDATTGFAQIVDGADVILVSGYTVADFGAGQRISSSDFAF